MLEQLEFSVCSLRKHRRAEWLHDLLYRDGLAGQLVFRRTFRCQRVLLLSPSQPSITQVIGSGSSIPDQSKGTHAHRLQVRVSDQQSDDRLSIRRCARGPVPAGDLEGGPKDLGPYEFRHVGGRQQIAVQVAA